MDDLYTKEWRDGQKAFDDGVDWGDNPHYSKTYPQKHVDWSDGWFARFICMRYLVDKAEMKYIRKVDNIG